MDAAHIHLILTHFPIVGTFLGMLILGYGEFFHKEEAKKIGLAVLIAMAIITVPVFLSGEEAEEILEHIPGIQESFIENHEEIAEKVIWIMSFLGGLALVNLWAIFKRKPLAKTLGKITLLVALFSFGMLARAGNAGGKIRHTEIRTSQSTANGKIKKDSSNPYYEEEED